MRYTCTCRCSVAFHLYWWHTCTCTCFGGLRASFDYVWSQSPLEKCNMYDKRSQYTITVWNQGTNVSLDWTAEEFNAKGLSFIQRAIWLHVELRQKVSAHFAALRTSVLTFLFLPFMSDWLLWSVKVQNWGLPAEWPYLNKRQFIWAMVERAL